MKRLKQTINHSKPVRGKDLDHKTYNKKFETCDFILKEGLLKSKRKDVASVIQDPTCFAYFFFKNDEGRRLKFTTYQDSIANCEHNFNPENPNRFVLFKASNQIGKVNSYDTLAPTPKGFVMIGELEVGDTVYGSDGKPTNVCAVFPHNNWPFYKITFDDGSICYAGTEHLWKCKTGKERFIKEYSKGSKRWNNPSYDQWVVRSTQDIIEAGNYSPHAKTNWSKVSIPLCDPVSYPFKELPIDPYALGLLLGDGSFTKGCKFTNADKELVRAMSERYRVRQSGKPIDYTVCGMTKSLKKLELHGKTCFDKHIPTPYLYSSIYQRTALLRGLMDTDGSYYGKGKVCEFCTVSENLKDGFIEIVNSLGGVINKCTKRETFYTRDGKKTYTGYAYYIRFKTLFNPFHLKRKADSWKPVTKYRHERLIERIEFSHTGPGACIVVDNEDRTYLIQKDYIVTHNSRTLACLAIQRAFTERNTNVVMVSKSLPQSQHLLATIRHILNNSAWGDTWKEDLGETANTTILTFQRDKGKVVNRIICAPCGEGLLGYTVHYLFLDEADFYENGKNFFWKVAYPRTNQTKGQIILFSNPNPDISRQASILWELWNGDLFKRKFSFNFLDAPWNTKKEYEVAKRNSPSYIFESTHGGEFPIDSGGFFTNQEISDMTMSSWKNRLPASDNPVYIGLDLAKMKDRTVLSLGKIVQNKDEESLSDLEVRYMMGFPTKTDYDKVIAEVKRIVKYYADNHRGVAAIGLDVSGVGRAVSDFARASGIKVTDVKFSLENKSRMYANFKMLAEQRRIRMVKVEECSDQLSTLMFKRTPSGYLSVKHERESLKDDYPDSIAALIDVSVMPSKVPVSATFVQYRKEQKREKGSDEDSRDLALRESVRKNTPSKYGFDGLEGFREW